MKNEKPLGRKSYGSIGHLSNSRMGSADKKIHEGQQRIATIEKRDNHDIVIVQEKLDGSNVGVARINGEILALSRAGYLANTSPYKMHHEFYSWVEKNKLRFKGILSDGERICGEWLTKPHGTIYHLPHEPFVAFDIIGDQNKRVVFDELHDRLCDKFVLPEILSVGDAYSVERAIECLGDFGFHGAQEKIEGAVWRVERKGVVDFLCKYVRPDKVDGKYLDDDSVVNTWQGNI